MQLYIYLTYKFVLRKKIKKKERKKILVLIRNSDKLSKSNLMTLHNRPNFPANTQRRNNVALTSPRRHDVCKNVAPISQRRHDVHNIVTPTSPRRMTSR